MILRQDREDIDAVMISKLSSAKDIYAYDEMIQPYIEEQEGEPVTDDSRFDF